MPEILEEHGQEKSTAIITYLQYMIDKCLDYNSRQTRWEYTRSVIKGTFGRHDFSLKWTFGEMMFTGANSGLAWGESQVLDAYRGICELINYKNVKPANVLNGSAANIAISDQSVDIICVDPPYYNNVQYAELSDYFYVWQKRTFRNLYPEVFGRRLTNKTDEAVANPVRDGGAKEADQVYEQRMREIFNECHRVLVDDGIITMMFTHKTQAAWETLTKALIESGWMITSAFPVHSEGANSTHQKDMAAAASSIFLACRKRDMSERAPAVWRGFGGTGVLQQLREAVRQSLADYDALHLNAVDEMVASYGCALKVLSENWPVMDGDELVTPTQAMREASTVVAQYQMTRLTKGRLSVEDLDPEAGIALTLFGIYGMGSFPFDDALSLSKSLNIRLENKAAGYRNEGRMIGINDERTGRRNRDDEVEGYYAPLVKRGSKLRLVLPEERNPRRLQNPQNEWDILQGLIMSFREGDMPVARAYLQRQAEGHEDIGRIDRIGQKYSDIEVLNMCYLGSTEEIVYGRLLERLKAANLVVGTQQISMLPVEPEEFRDLQNGTLSEDELEQRSKQRLRKQRAATAAMEISADDQYAMYKRLSANAKSLSSPATIYDLWDAFVSSSYLASKGATTSANHIWHLPGSEDFCETYTTISRNDASENFPFLTWGNESVDAILNAISCKIPKDGPIQRISVQHNGVERISYLVASVSGPMLIKSVSDLDGLQITPNGFLTAPDIAAAKQTLAEFLDSEQDQVLLAKKSEQENQKYAGLQEALVQEVAKQILQQEEDCGNSKYSDAMRHLEETRRQIRHVSLHRPAARH